MVSAADLSEVRRKASLAMPSFNKNKLTIDITLDETQESPVPAYTTLEPISGEASVTAPVDTPFDGIHITFQGSVKTFVEKIATSAPTNSRSSAFHTFLRLTQPLEADLIPEDRILKARTTYKFPFTFVVPEKLLPQACAHSATDPVVTEAHLQLPPSLGDPMVSHDGKTLLDDMCPENARVSYSVRVLVLSRSKPGDKASTIADCQKKIRILPAVVEAPPVHALEGNEDDYILSTTKSIKKGLFSGKTGNLTAEALQPAPFYLPHPNQIDACPVSATATINLTFEAFDATTKPPKLGMLNSRLKIGTFFSTAPMKTMPAKSSSFHYESNKGIYVDTVTLASRCVAAVQWKKDENPVRRDSAVSLSRMAETSRRGSKSRASTPPPDAAVYTASILVPLALPKTKAFIPTFHSCLVSRIYLLDLVLSVQSGSNIHLKIPIQVASCGNPDARPQISAEEAVAIARREADGYFEPRLVSPGNVTPDSDGENMTRRPLPPPPQLMRGARGSIFQTRLGSLSGSGSEGEYEEPPSYTPHTRNVVVMS